MPRSVPSVVALLVCLVLPMPAFAQGRMPSRWGVGVSFHPHWHALDDLKIVFDDAEAIDIDGSDFQIGVVRGRDDAGEWSVGLVHGSTPLRELNDVTWRNDRLGGAAHLFNPAACPEAPPDTAA